VVCIIAMAQTGSNFPGKVAVDLLKELYEEPRLKPFPYDKRTEIINEITRLQNVGKETAIVMRQKKEEDPHFDLTPYAPFLDMHVQGINRNVAAFIEYLRCRLELVEKIRWEVGGVVPEDRRPNLSEPENSFFENYSTILGRYMSNLGNLDLTSYLGSPPKDYLVTVQVVKTTAVKISVENLGTVELIEGKRFTCPYGQAELFIKNGTVKIVR